MVGQPAIGVENGLKWTVIVLRRVIEFVSVVDGKKKCSPPYAERKWLERMRMKCQLTCNSLRDVN